MLYLILIKEVVLLSHHRDLFSLERIVRLCFMMQALQAPACHENMVKVGGYILGEFGNLIAGDQRSSPLVQFQLLHSKVSCNLKLFLLTIYFIQRDEVPVLNYLAMRCMGEWRYSFMHC
jgi:hypothetical protein